MKYLLDTNICIYIINRNPAKIFDRFQSLKIGDLGISVITYSELQYGVFNSSKIKQNTEALQQFIAPLNVLEFPNEAAEVYGKVRSQLKKSGKNVGPMDILIASHCMALDLTLITNNEKEFKKIKDLKIENWAK